MALEYINLISYFLDSWQISCYFDTKFTTVAQIEQILWKFKDPKIAKILNLEEVYFLVTRVKYDRPFILGDDKGTFWNLKKIQKILIQSMKVSSFMN